jgi:uncharacterized membrane protein
MEFALFNIEGFLYLLRWLHYIFGIIWIGHLYYFNFTQGPFFAETDATTKSGAIQKLVPRALWWFRWGAMGTFVTGLIILMTKGHQNPAIFGTAWGVSLLTGGALATLMWANVWFVIWPAQKIVIASATQVAKGGAAIPEAAGAAARAGLASRTNVLFSIPMLFYMGAGSHLPLMITATSLMPLALVLTVIILALEANGLKGKMGPMTTVRGVITSGFVLTLVLYLAMEVLTK